MDLFGIDLKVIGRECCILTSICIGLVLVRTLRLSTYQSSVNSMVKGRRKKSKQNERDDIVGVEVSSPDHFRISKHRHNLSFLRFPLTTVVSQNTFLPILKANRSFVDMKWPHCYRIFRKTLHPGLIVSHRGMRTNYGESTHFKR